MEKDDEIVQSLIAGGLIGAALGALLSKNKEEGASLGALAGAAILATFKASKQKRVTCPYFMKKIVVCMKFSQTAAKSLLKNWNPRTDYQAKPLS